MQHREYRLNVQAVERSCVCQSAFFVADMQSAIVEPDICLDTYGADGEGAVEWYWSPVVVVRVEGFGYDALCEVGRVGVLWSGVSVREDGLEWVREGDIGLGSCVGCREGGKGE